MIDVSEHEWDPGNYDPNEPTYPTDAAWRNAGVGNEDWERYNSQLTYEWLRFYERATEFAQEQLRKHRMAYAPVGWLDVQKARFRRSLDLRYFGQSEPDPRWIFERRRRLRARHGEDRVAEFDAKWAAHNPSHRGDEPDVRQRQSGDVG